MAPELDCGYDRLQRAQVIDGRPAFDVAFGTRRPSAPANVGGEGGGPNIGVRGKRFVAANRVLREIIDTCL